MKSFTHAFTAAALVLATAIAGAWAPQPEKPATEVQQTQFLAFDIVIDAGNEPLAVYQVEIKDSKGHARIVGIEGGEPGAYNDAPHYDPRAIQDEHVILGAFTTANAPTGKVRVARLHIMAEGGAPDFTSTITTAAPGGRTFNATLSIQPLTKPSGDRQ